MTIAITHTTSFARHRMHNIDMMTSTLNDMKASVATSCQPCNSQYTPPYIGAPQFAHGSRMVHLSRWVFHAHGPEGKRLLRRSHQRGEEYCYVSFDLQFPRNNGIWGGHERDVPDEYQHRHQMQIDPIGNRNGPHDLQPSSCKGEWRSSECAVLELWRGYLHVALYGMVICTKKTKYYPQSCANDGHCLCFKDFLPLFCHPKWKERK